MQRLDSSTLSTAFNHVLAHYIRHVTCYHVQYSRLKSLQQDYYYLLSLDVRLSSYQRVLGPRKLFEGIVRYVLGNIDLHEHFTFFSMPNTPAMVLEAITVWTATKDTPENLIKMTRELLGIFSTQFIDP